MDPWKVIYVSSRAEKKVAERLTAAGIEAYVPLKKEMKQWSDRKKMVESPMIAGYVFVRVSALQRDRVLQFAGVLQYVRYNGADAIVRKIEIDALRSIAEKGYHITSMQTKAIEVGAVALIAHGLFKGFKGKVSKLSGGTNYTIVLDSISHSISLTVPSEVVYE